MSKGWFYLVVDDKNKIIVSQRALTAEEEAVDVATGALRDDPKNTFYVLKAIKSVHRPDSVVEDTEDPEIPF